MDEIKHEDDYKMFSEANDPEGLWQAVVWTHKVTMVSRVKGVINRLARKQYQKIKQGGYEPLISYQEHFDEALKAYQEQENPNMEDIDIAHDFLMALIMGGMLSSKQISITGWQQK